MDITDRINQRRLEVIASRNYEPKSIYLGSDEAEELIDWAVVKYDLQLRPTTADGLEFLGMKVFEVKAAKHLCVA